MPRPFVPRPFKETARRGERAVGNLARTYRIQMMQVRLFDGKELEELLNMGFLLFLTLVDYLWSVPLKTWGDLIIFDFTV